MPATLANVTTTRSGEPIPSSDRTPVRTLAGLLRACHPEPGAAVTAGSALLALSTGRDARGVAAVAAAVAASQLTVGWHNDWLDADRDAQSGRTDKPLAT